MKSKSNPKAKPTGEAIKAHAARVSCTKPLLLIDGSSYLHRAYHAMPELMTTHGQPTGAIYGVINMIRKLVHDYNPSHIAVVFDAKGKNFRHELYPEYKANRIAMPEELRGQIKPLHEVIEAMGLPLLTIAGVEADDVIGTLVKQAKHVGMCIVISTGDKDLAQLVDKDVTLVNTMSDKILDIAGVKEKFGVAPEQMIDYLSLVGDSSDNVRGVPSVGPKTAVKLLHEYHSIDGIMHHVQEIGGKLGENLQAHLSNMPLTKKLIEIKQDVPLDYEIKDLQRKEPNNEKLIELFKQLEFKSWLSAMLTGQPKVEKGKNYHLILLPDEFEKLLKKLHAAKIFSVDLETTGLDVINAQIVGISVAIEVGEAFYIPVAHDYLGAPEQQNRDEVLKKLRPILEDKHISKLGQNLKYDMSVLANYGIHLQGATFDTMLESYLLNSGEMRHDKETLALKYLGEKIITFEELAGKGAKQLSFNQLKIEAAFPYAAQDADLALRLHKILWKELSDYPKLIKIFQEIEMPLMEVLSRMERNGVRVDENLLARQSMHLEKQLHKLEAEAYKLAQQEFNLNSPQQLQEILFEKLKLPMLKKTPTGQPSTAEQTLQELAIDYPLPKLILEYRSLSKLKSTYTDALVAQINPTTQRIHTSYQQAVTITGRLSSTNPNLQNIPARTDEGRQIRQAFIAEEGYKIISADYSQIELRVMAHLAQDEGLLPS